MKKVDIKLYELNWIEFDRNKSVNVIFNLVQKANIYPHLTMRDLNFNENNINAIHCG